MASRLPNGSIKMSDGRTVFANSVLLAGDLQELLPFFSPPQHFIAFTGRGGSGGGSGFGGGGGGGGSGAGSVGPAGPAGADGAEGPQGSQGFQGTNPGPQGSQGPQGNQGLRGFQGFTGTGVQGPQGFQGLVGLQGNQGNQGLTGPQGNQGIAGSTGVQGNQGNQGLTGSGAQGNQGLQGFQGVTGTSGTNGAQGPQGFQGAQGLQGFQGLTGPQGNQGNQGLQGPQGFQGFQGLSGPQGAQGNQGLQGFQGFQGSGTSAFEFLQRVEVTGSPASEITFSGLDGNTDINYLIKLQTIGNNEDDSGSLYLRPNNVTTDQQAQTMFSVGATITANSETLLLIGTFQTGIASDSPNYAEIIFRASNENGAVRAFIASWIENMDPAGAIIQRQTSGVWADTATNVTSLVLHATALVFDVGTVAELYRIVPQ